MSFIVTLLILPAVGYALHFIINRKFIDRIFETPQLQSTEEAKTLEKSAGDSRVPANHLRFFPPSRRSALQDVSAEASRTPPGFNLYAELLPETQLANFPIQHDHFTATGITLREIEQLGNFPIYATLSGVKLPDPYTEFDIARALPRPYRPFRWTYHQTMSYQKLDSNWWLELHSNYSETIKLRTELYEIQGPNVLQVLPGAELAAKELMEMCLQFVCARYPHHFRLSENNTNFHNMILGTKTDLPTTPPLLVLLQNIPEDFAIMLRDPKTGLYTFRAGIIMSSLGWSLGSKIGKTLSEIHQPVPDYKEKMQLSMDRYLARMPTDKPIQRGSWGIEVGKPLFMAPDDPKMSERGEQNPAHTIDDMHLRVDWQTLRRLPLSGAIVFNFKGLFTPVTEFRDEACIPTLLLKMLREGKKSIMEYKGTWHTEHVVIPALEAYEKEQIEKGLVKEDWQPQTLEENPFFPGWQEKWHRQQGF